MASAAKLNLTIYQGSTFSEVLRWEGPTKVYKNITGITQTAPITLTVSNHGIPDGWRVKITNVGGMKEINSSDTYRKAKVINPNAIEINDINAVGYTAYTTGGVVEYNQPKDLTGYTARMQIRSKLEADTFLLELTTENGGITLDNVNKTITLNISATTTAAITWVAGVYSLEMVVSGTVSTLLTGNVTVKKEVTR